MQIRFTTKFDAVEPILKMDYQGRAHCTQNWRPRLDRRHG